MAAMRLVLHKYLGIVHIVSLCVISALWGKHNCCSTNVDYNINGTVQVKPSEKEPYAFFNLHVYQGVSQDLGQLVVTLKHIV